MSVYIKCPMCGLNSHLSRFNPEKLGNTMELIEMRSLGRAKGWEVTDRFSALDDEELMDRIASRCRVILKILGEEVPKPEEADLVAQLRDEISGLQETADDYEEEMDNILAKVNIALNSVYEGKFSTLEEAVEALITEYNEAMEEAEDEEDEDDDEVEDEEEEVDFESLSELDKQIHLAEQDEKKAEDEDE